MLNLRASAAALLLLLAVLEIHGKVHENIDDNHQKLCDLAKTTVNDISGYMKIIKTQWLRDCTKQRDAIKRVKEDLRTFDDKRGALGFKSLPSRQTLEKMTEECDDFITTLKGILKHTNQFRIKELLCPKDSEKINEAAQKMGNRIFRCGYGQRGMTLSHGTIAQVDSKQLVGLRRRRQVLELEEEELEDMPIEGKDGVVAHLKGKKEGMQVRNRVTELLRARGKKTSPRGAAVRSLFNIALEHKCICQKSDCKCCLLVVNKSKKDDEPWSACMGLEMLTECKRKGIKIYIDVMGISKDLIIMEGSSTCYNFPNIPLSICMEPYGFHFCPRRGTFRSCLMLQLEVLGFKIASYNLDCLVLSYTKEGGVGLRLRKAKPNWLPQEGALNILFNWISDIFVSQYEDKLDTLK